jgi:hypothetical protein
VSVAFVGGEKQMGQVYVERRDGVGAQDGRGAGWRVLVEVDLDIEEPVMMISDIKGSSNPSELGLGRL